MSRHVIALSGWKGSGKDTAADYLTREYGFRKASFAGKLKDMVSETYNVPREYMDSPSLKEMPLPNLPVSPQDKSSERLHDIFRTELRNGLWTPRALCILEGAVKRAVAPDYWTRVVMQEIANNPTQSYVITDLRYKNEAEIVKLFFGNALIVRINRFDSSPTTDPSERDMDDYAFDITINNRTTTEDLYSSLDVMLASISSSF